MDPWRPLGRPRVERPGDWTCSRCQLVTFASKAACFHCGQPRSRTVGGPEPGSTVLVPTFVPAATVKDVAGVSVGTLNVLHPAYAIKYNQQEGLDVYGRSNWAERLPAIASALLTHALDAYLLQELGHAEAEDLRATLSGAYEVVHAQHPARGWHDGYGWKGGDGVAVLLRLDSMAPCAPQEEPLLCGWQSAPREPYMATALACALHKPSGSRVLLASAHLYAKKAHAPQETLLAQLAERQREAQADVVVWGGDCNRAYAPSELPGYACARAVRPTRRQSGKVLDWIFARTASGPVEPVRTEATEAFVRSSWEPRMVSDHYAEAVLVPVGPPLTRRW